MLGLAEIVTKLLVNRLLDAAVLTGLEKLEGENIGRSRGARSTTSGMCNQERG